MLITLSRRVSICQSVAEVQLTGVASLGAVGHRFNFLKSYSSYSQVSFVLLNHPKHHNWYHSPYRVKTFLTNVVYSFLPCAFPLHTLTQSLSSYPPHPIYRYFPTPHLKLHSAYLWTTQVSAGSNFRFSLFMQYKVVIMK